MLTSVGSTSERAGCSSTSSKVSAASPVMDVMIFAKERPFQCREKTGSPRRRLGRSRGLARVISTGAGKCKGRWSGCPRHAMMRARQYCRRSGEDRLDTSIAWPVKQRELVMWVIDLRPWNGFEFRDDDIVIATWSKSGTTWTQQIVSQLIFAGEPDLYGPDRSPWPDFRMAPDDARARCRSDAPAVPQDPPADRVARLFSQREIPLHRPRRPRLPTGAGTTITVASRRSMLDSINALYPDEPPVPYPNPDVRLAFLDWLDRDAYPNWPFWSHVQGLVRRPAPAQSQAGPLRRPQGRPEGRNREDRRLP